MPVALYLYAEVSDRPMQPDTPLGWVKPVTEHWARGPDRPLLQPERL